MQALCDRSAAVGVLGEQCGTALGRGCRHIVKCEVSVRELEGPWAAGAWRACAHSRSHLASSDRHRQLRKHSKLQNTSGHDLAWLETDSEEEAEATDSQPSPRPLPAHFPRPLTCTICSSSASSSTSLFHLHSNPDHPLHRNACHHTCHYHVWPHTSQNP